MKRHQGVTTQQQAVNGFFQGEVEDALFIVVKLDRSLKVYPTISGHRHRYSISFMDLKAENIRNSAQTIEFEQSIC